ncbi:hypothetical protein OAG71_03405 [bacterium]|nr:hypothetical protein [bacterium]
MKNILFQTLIYAAAVLSSSACCHQASAHDGRRLDIQVINNQLFAQGYLSGFVQGETVNEQPVREKYNVVHDHFTNIPSGAIGSLPGFDIVDASPLLGSSVTLELLGVTKWTPPARDPLAAEQMFGVPALEALSANETLSIGFSTQAGIDSNSLGSFTLASDISAPVLDIDLNYSLDADPTGSIYAVQWQLATDNPNIADSSGVYTLLSPGGMGPDERLHFQSLALEDFLGVTVAAVPEPGPLALLALSIVPVTLRRRR